MQHQAVAISTFLLPNPPPGKLIQGIHVTQLETLSIRTVL